MRSPACARAGPSGLESIQHSWHGEELADVVFLNRWLADLQAGQVREAPGHARVDAFGVSVFVPDALQSSRHVESRGVHALRVDVTIR
jgi:hypothetical protein